MTEVLPVWKKMLQIPDVSIRAFFRGKVPKMTFRWNVSSETQQIMKTLKSSRYNVTIYSVTHILNLVAGTMPEMKMTFPNLAPIPLLFIFGLQGEILGSPSCLEFLLQCDSYLLNLVAGNKPEMRTSFPNYVPLLFILDLLRGILGSAPCQATT